MFVMTPQKYSQNFHTQIFFHILNTPKTIEIRNFEPKKLAQAYV